MQRRLIACAIMVLIGLGSLIGTQAAETVATLDVNSAYIWRGITLNDGLVAQPSIDVAGPGGLGINVWASFDLDDYDGAYEKNEFSEVDLTLYYAIPFVPFEATLSYAEYLYPHQVDEEGNAWPGNREVILEVGHELIGNLSASALVGYELDEVKDFYAEIGLSAGMDVIADVLSAELAVAASYVGKDWAIANADGTDGGFSHWNAALSMTHAPTEAVELSATVGYTDTLDEDVLPEQDVDVYGGVSAAVTF